MGFFFSLNTAMKSFLVVLLFSALIAFASAQTSFLPPSALADSPDNVSPDSPLSPIGDSVSYYIYELSPLSDLIVLPSAFSYGSGPFRPFTKISDDDLNNHLSVSSLSPITIPSYSPFAPLFGSHSGAGVIQMSMGLLVACVIAAFAF